MTRFKSRLISAGVGLACAGAASTGANASILVDVYIYNGITWGQYADAATLANASSHSVATYEFLYSGLNDITWNNFAPPGSSNTGADFVGASNPNVGAFTIGTYAAFKNQVLSTAGGATTAFFKITGFLSGTIGPASQITHDDGATFTVGNDILVNSPGLTPQETSPFLITGQTYTNEAFKLYYVEGNASPAILNVKIDSPNLTTDVPEPSTWAMMILGFCGIGFLAYRRKSKPAFRLA
jgi:hypothetical protein